MLSRKCKGGEEHEKMKKRSRRETCIHKLDFSILTGSLQTEATVLPELDEASKVLVASNIDRCDHVLRELLK